MLNEFFLICDVNDYFKECTLFYWTLFVVKKEPYKKIPDKVIELKPNNRVVWDYNRAKTPYRLTGFHLLDGKEVYEYQAEETVLLKLKDIFS